jgi:hypothetical protein
MLENTCRIILSTLHTPQKKVIVSFLPPLVKTSYKMPLYNLINIA